MLNIRTSEDGVKVTMAGTIKTICNDMFNVISDVYNALYEVDQEEAMLFRVATETLVNSDDLWDKRKPRETEEKEDKDEGNN